jgi:hypothetical protein
MVLEPLVTQRLLIIETSRSHSLRHSKSGRTVEDEWSSGLRDLSLTTHNTHKRQTDIHAPGGIRTRNPSKRAVTDPLLRPRGHWDRSLYLYPD